MLDHPSNQNSLCSSNKWTKEHSWRREDIYIYKSTKSNVCKEKHENN